MKELTEIVKAASVAYLNAIEPDDIIPVGHHAAIAAAVAAVAPILLEKPTPEERGIAGADYLAFNGEFPVDYRTVLQFTLKNFAANRLASLTAKPDPAVEAVKRAIEKYGSIVNNPDFHTEEAKRIVAAVDAARAKQ